MGWPAIIAAGGAILGGLLSGQSTERTGETSANAQIRAAQLGVDEQRAARQELAQGLAPFERFGLEARFPLENLLGIGGNIEELTSRRDMFQERLAAAEPGTVEHRSLVRNISNLNAQIEQRQHGLAPEQVDLASLSPLPDVFDPATIMETPQFRFLQEEGFRGINEGAAGGGRNPDRDLSRFQAGLLSTVVPQIQQQQFNQGLVRRGTELAEQSGLRAEAINENQQRINNLMQALGIGQTAATRTGVAGLQTASNVSNILGNVGLAGAQAAQQQNLANQQMIGGGLTGLGILLGGRQQTNQAPNFGQGAGFAPPANFGQGLF